METYKAILRGSRLEWRCDAPAQLNTGNGVEVYVTIVQETAAAPKMASDGKAMAEALSRLVASSSLSQMIDPTAWQREQRQDRGLPDRDS